jgi:hypothetical protein
MHFVPSRRYNATCFLSAPPSVGGFWRRWLPRTSMKERQDLDHLETDVEFADKCWSLCPEGII